SLASGTKRPADDVPLSPALSGRQGSIRKLLSRTFLNNSYEEGAAQANGTGTPNGSRPSSRNTSLLDEKKAKRSSGWFRRLRPGSSSDGTLKRSSSLYQEASSQQAPTKPAGPPPPMIPEFNTLSPKLGFGTEGSLGGSDLFKNIK
ncbi:hypothetical protein IMZ48_41320, partial [Candidatus Bathyarchaeota archaeon]|nr:hypothetical protein [Candidatus Bathyarchaeota archaeon]